MTRVYVGKSFGDLERLICLCNILINKLVAGKLQSRFEVSQTCELVLTQSRIGFLFFTKN